MRVIKRYKLDFNKIQSRANLQADVPLPEFGKVLLFAEIDGLFVIFVEADENHFKRWRRFIIVRDDEPFSALPEKRLEYVGTSFVEGFFEFHLYQEVDF